MSSTDLFLVDPLISFTFHFDFVKFDLNADSRADVNATLRKFILNNLNYRVGIILISNYQIIRGLICFDRCYESPLIFSVNPLRWQLIRGPYTIIRRFPFLLSSSV